ncbi:glutaredoxin domain-containing protein [Streptomyces sp. NPDC053541]|uniref:glutaredoxin domain-containing protein n=1 Tax=Streptomyces sp. NPDC053541 TaxID=3365709 RepID=UPI0037CD4180
MTRAWTLPTLFLLCGLLVATPTFLEGEPVRAGVLLTVFLLIAAAHSPLVFPRPLRAEEARRRSAQDGRPVVYWRPGCRYCIRLRLGLGRDARRVHWVDIWRDADAAAELRAVNGGDETVPTVFVDGSPHVNPGPAWVRDHLARRA